MIAIYFVCLMRVKLTFHWLCENCFWYNMKTVIFKHLHCTYLSNQRLKKLNHPVA